MEGKNNLIVDVDFKLNNRSPLKDYLEDVTSKYHIIKASLDMLPSGEHKEEMLSNLADSLERAIRKIDEYCSHRKRY